MEAVIFCGIQASGKTTFYKKHFFNSHIRISLDQLNTRNKEEKFISTCLATQQRFVIDNTNPTKEDRARYISIAKAHKFKVVCYYFHSSLNDALKRNNKRNGKENIPEIGIKGTFNKFDIPTFAEGFEEMYIVELEGQNFKIQKILI